MSQHMKPCHLMQSLWFSLFDETHVETLLPTTCSTHCSYVDHGLMGPREFCPGNYEVLTLTWTCLDTLGALPPKLALSPFPWNHSKTSVKERGVFVTLDKFLHFTYASIQPSKTTPSRLQWSWVPLQVCILIAFPSHLGLQFSSIFLASASHQYSAS